MYVCKLCIHACIDRMTTKDSQHNTEDTYKGETAVTLHHLSHFNTNTDLNYIQNLSSYLTEIAVRVHNENRSVNDADGNISCLL